MSSLSSSLSSSAVCDGDSALSIAGNVSGILTFGFAVLVGIQIRANAFRSAKYEMLEMKSRLESRTRDVYALQTKVINAVEKHDQLGAPLEPYLKMHLTNLMEEIRQPMRDAQGLLGRVLSEERDSGFYRVVYSTRFVVEKTAIQRCLEALDYRGSGREGTATVYAGVLDEGVGVDEGEAECYGATSGPSAPRGAKR
ncbi:MAG: hypothetical protein Q9160_007887 [Pyrenula sp. 1 TL-2023]